MKNATFAHLRHEGWGWECMKSEANAAARADLAARVIDIIATKLEVDIALVQPMARLSEDLGADSLDTVQLSFELEKEFGIEITERAAKKLLTVGDVIGYIQQHPHAE